MEGNKNRLSSTDGLFLKEALIEKGESFGRRKTTKRRAGIYK